MNRIKELREQHRMTQVRLSVELGVSQETISAYEKGKCYPRYQSIEKMADLFHVSMDYLMGRSDRLLETGPVTSQDELALALFQKLNERKKEKAIAYLHGLSDD